MLRGVIFDIDGTLVDSNDAHARAWVETFAEAGYDVPFEVVRPLIGMGGDKLLPRTVGLKHDSREGKILGKRRSELFREKYLPALRALPGSRQLVERVRADGRRGPGGRLFGNLTPPRCRLRSSACTSISIGPITKSSRVFGPR